MIDAYFRKPLFWDYLMVAIAIIPIGVLFHFGKIEIPHKDAVMSISSDVSGISFMSAGFIMTLVTILITFKSGTNISKKNYDSSNTLFELFFASDLYFETIKHFKNGIKSLITISVIGYIFRLFMFCNKDLLLFLYCVAGIIIITATLWRCILILTKVLDLQKEKQEE